MNFPDIISALPQIDVPIEGLESHLIQGPHQQVVFMAFEGDVDVPEHSHEEQWGVVLEGKIDLAIGGEKHTLTKGDSYLIPRGTVHSARIYAGYKDLTVFNQGDRYKVKA